MLKLQSERARRLGQKFIDDTKGATAILFSGVLLVLVFAVGSALDLSRMESAKVEAQNAADSAALAAAIYMSEPEANPGGNLFQRHFDYIKKRREARDLGKTLFSEQLAGETFSQSETKVYLSLTTVTVKSKISVKPIFMGIVKRKAFDIEIRSVANMRQANAHDVDIVLAADATGSMQTTLDGIQSNMKGFAKDLSAELSGRQLELGRVRVKFVFFRDYMIDNHKNWTSPTAALQSGMEEFGPMYISPFYNLPAQDTEMDNYVDFFVAQGGGSFRESGLEAVTHALDDPDWGDGDTTVRAVVLWTDAVPRPFGDTEEQSLNPDTSEFSYWNNAYWDEKIGSAFTAKDKTAREIHMFRNYYPPKMPGHIGALQSKFNAFHSDNANGFSGVETMTINLLADCSGFNPCGDYDAMAAWDGVQVNRITDVLTADDTYNKIVKQIADTVETQADTKKIAIKS